MQKLCVEKDFRYSQSICRVMDSGRMKWIPLYRGKLFLSSKQCFIMQRSIETIFPLGQIASAHISACWHTVQNCS